MDGKTTEIRYQQWIQVIRDWSNSGLSKREYCRQNEINEKKLYYYQRRIRGIIASQTEQQALSEGSTGLSPIAISAGNQIVGAVAGATFFSEIYIDKLVVNHGEGVILVNDPFVTIDLHGLMRDDAMRRIDRALRDAGPGVYQLRLIHGYHRGTSLRSMIHDQYRQLCINHGFGNWIIALIKYDNCGMINNKINYRICG